MLFELPGLSPKQVGSVLAAPAPFAVRTLACFMRRFAFGGLRIDEALRLIFGALHMPGEAQKVDRIMQAFAAALFRDAPGPFVDADAAYVCAFSLMMLNTDLQHRQSARLRSAPARPLCPPGARLAAQGSVGTPRARPQPLSAPPPPQLLERAASKVADSTPVVTVGSTACTLSCCTRA